MIEFQLPNLGEGAKSGTITKLLVKPGDVIAAEQAVVEIEAEKATLELPCPHAGKVAKVHVKPGDVVETGAPILSIDEAGAGAGKGEKKPDEPKAEKAEKPKAPEKADKPKAPEQPKPAPEPRPARTAVAEPGDGRHHGAPLPAGPAVRRLARLLGIDLGQVSGTGERGRIKAEDVHAHLERLKSGAGAGGARVALPPLPDFTRWGEVTTEPVTGLRRATAEAMTRSWTTIPAVTNHELVDITDLEAARKAWGAANPDAPKVTLTVPLLKAIVAALKRFPKFNASLDLERGQVILKKHYHLGVAVDTPNGLLVPVVRDVDRKPLLAIAQELADLARKARDKKLGLEEMKGATFTISNLGSIGAWGFSPIINWPEVAILGVSRAREEYRPGPEGPTLRLICPLSLTYDHRLIDGAEAARFLRYLSDLLASPAALLFAS